MEFGGGGRGKCVGIGYYFFFGGLCDGSRGIFIIVDGKYIGIRFIRDLYYS